ncbi:endoplasmic reticulum protein [Lentinula raphanica]|uniref:Endoplasmic reticulum transmembrane protein n=1 Tax=Lentinula raphanica TaxID=153919 RepID=A0AA38P6K0_9AGAR|nr:endoplasmic reticulum protein [Lentinula raphanica]KAJ3824471.1 endoplasmic reticulum protein [Lentinula raphanica]KAJ3837245.1 endoplasmic reticulum protein [Lentinula raphanica]KAJ3972548.1 endoplasmic reticulum protein [Lentinula raphanica]
MTIYYSLTFLLLAAEMVTFTALVIPFPFAIRKRVFSFLSESPIVAKIAYGIKISFIFVGILFFDALQRMFRITAESDMAKTNQQGMGVGDIRTETSFAARKFYAQRNVYLTGFTLFLSLVLTRTFAINLELIHSQEEYAKLKKASPSSGSDIEKKASEYDSLKTKFESQTKEYNQLADKYNKLTGGKADKKKD